jgi:metal-sulfur cluster biosynthetic enzyme
MDSQAPYTTDQIRAALRKVKDPELAINIVDLGLVYDVRVDGPEVQIDMSLTSPGCPAGGQIISDTERAVREMDGIEDVTVNLVWSPPWTPERIEPRVKAYLGF